MMRIAVHLLLASAILGPASNVNGLAVICYDDEAFLDAVGTVHLINFIDLPNGRPSYDGAEITHSFNYEGAGAFFNSPTGILSLQMREIGDFQLAAMAVPPERAWIDVRPTNPSRGVAILYEGQTTLSAYDDAGVLIAVAVPRDTVGLPRHDGHDHGGFLGIVSDVPIASVRVERGESFEAIHGFLFSPVPEPATVSALLLCAVLVRGRRPRIVRCEVCGPDLEDSAGRCGHMPL